MNNWLFESANTIYSIQLPENWAEYEDEENVSAFFNKNIWSGNLRITSFYWSEEDTDIDKVTEYFQSELNDIPAAKLIKLGKWHAVFYSKELDKDSIIHYWITGEKKNLFFCSFTFDKSLFETDFYNDELMVVYNIIKSIEIKLKN